MELFSVFVLAIEGEIIENIVAILQSFSSGEDLVFGVFGVYIQGNLLSYYAIVFHRCLCRNLELFQGFFSDFCALLFLHCIDDFIHTCREFQVVGIPIIREGNRAGWGELKLGHKVVGKLLPNGKFCIEELTFIDFLRLVAHKDSLGSVLHHSCKVSKVKLPFYLSIDGVWGIDADNPVALVNVGIYLYAWHTHLLPFGEIMNIMKRSI